MSIEVAATPGARGAICFTVSGSVDETFDAAPLLGRYEPITIVDLNGMQRITSFGVRRWSEAMKSLPREVRHLYLTRCPPGFVDQLNMVLNFGGRAEVVSVRANFFCAQCQKEQRPLVDVVSQRERLVAGAVDPARCPDCGQPMQLDDDPAQYFRFVEKYGARAVDPQAAEVLHSRGLTALEKARGPDEVKLVHGDVTLFRLGGMLDARFRPRRLAAGVEGHVLFDLSGVEGIDATGAERWRELIGSLSAVTSIVVLELAIPLRELAAAGQLALDRVQLHSVQARFQCARCGSRWVDGVRANELASAPTRPCRKCATHATLSEDGAALRSLFGRRPASPLPRQVMEVIARRRELLERARTGSDSRRPGDRSDTETTPSRYRVVRPLSTGGMATLLLAVHESIGGFQKLVALKKIHRKLLEQMNIAVEYFLSEARIAANLNHPHIAQIFEVGEHAGDLVLAMEYVPGVDLRAMLVDGVAAGKRLPLAEVLLIGKQVASALHHAHHAIDLRGRKLGIVHRDVSPSNIMVGFDGQVKLVDFGIATAVVDPKREDGVVGKLAYMPPEQLEGGELDGRADLFALGVVLYELVMGRSLFRRRDDEQTRAAVFHDPLPSLAEYGVPSFAEQVLARALARRPEERYPDGAAFEAAIDQVLIKLGATPTPQQLSEYVRGVFPDRAMRAGTSESYFAKQEGAVVEMVPFAESQRTGMAPQTPPQPQPGARPTPSEPAPAAPASQLVQLSTPTPSEPHTIAPRWRAAPPHDGPGVQPMSVPASAERTRRSWFWPLVILIVAVTVLLAAGLIYTTLI